METRTLSWARGQLFWCLWVCEVVVGVANLPPCDDVVPVWSPCQREWLLADSYFADAGFGAYVPESDHAVCAAARQLVLVDRVEGDALK
jgi:hypothetical protein